MKRYYFVLCKTGHYCSGKSQKIKFKTKKTKKKKTKMEHECEFLVILKPDSVRRGLIGEIISSFEKMGFQLESMGKKRVPGDYLKILYGHLNPTIFEKNCDFMKSGDCIISTWRGNVQAARKMIGETDPLRRDPSSIRGKYSNSIRYNIIHCSDSVESAKNEVDELKKLSIL